MTSDAGRSTSTPISVRNLPEYDFYRIEAQHLHYQFKTGGISKRARIAARKNIERILSLISVEKLANLLLI